MLAEVIEMSNHKLCVGVITAPHGVRGQVRVKSFTAEPGDIARYAPLMDADGEREYRLEFVGHAKGVLLASVEGVRDRNAAETLRGAELFIDRDTLSGPEDEDEFYHADLVGLTAVQRDGSAYGTVKALHDFGAGDMIEFELAESGDVILPFTRAVVPEIDLEQSRLVVDPPDMIDVPGSVAPARGEDEEVSG